MCASTWLLLKLFPKVAYREGLAEVIKYAFIKDKRFAKWLLDKQDKILQQERKLLLKIVQHCIAIKHEVVSADEKETNSYRQILNFGHTIAHAIEKTSDYKIKHGMAVAIGMAMESFLAARLDVLSKMDYEFVVRLLKTYGFSLEIPVDLSATLLYRAMLVDKKNTSQKIDAAINFALINKIGSPYRKEKKYSLALSKAFVLESIDLYQQSSPST